MRQSKTEMTLQRGASPALQTGPREADVLPFVKDELSEFAAEPGITDSATRRATPDNRR
ncbi:hypothetical protein [Paenibacillus thermotolerans]|uniref:hypothetical protein n=1 Tax=Paenibacillus thermotolerans TaxID=3027807 RepID=UPI002368A241|nr:MULTISPECIES: hypothetical protein [unclassified Paenibacillus]